LVVVVVVAAAKASVSSIEIYNGNYYGFDDPHASGVIPTSAPGGDVDQEQPLTGHGGSGRRGHGNRGRHGQGHRHHHHHHHGDNNTNPHQWSDEQKLTHLCAMMTPSGRGVSSRRSSNNGSNLHGDKMARKLQMLGAEHRQTVTDMWNRRKEDIKRCCSEDSINRKLQCVNQTRVARYDRVCRGEEPLCAWAQYMPNPNAESWKRSIGNTTTTCCSRQGVERLECFGVARAEYKKQYEQMKKNQHGGSHEERRRTEPHSAHGGDERVSSRRGANGGNRRPRPATESNP